ncbi:hypothetical protein MBLNU457_6207t1 [Dothideomycetes sp. NU457]
MTKATQQITLFTILASIYAALFMNIVPLPSTIRDDIVPVLPFWAIVSFGAFLLAKLGYNVMTFNDVPEAYAELMGEIDIAKSELRLKGVEVD